MSVERFEGARDMTREDYSTEFEDLMKQLRDLLVRGFKDQDLTMAERVDLYHEASERVTDFIDGACNDAGLNPYAPLDDDSLESDEEDED